MNAENILICPVCRRKLNAEEPLTPTPESNGRAWSCPHRHSFDMASAGYLNLLPPSGKGIHGDNKQMIEARRALLDSGLYAPLRERLVSLLADRLQADAVIWDSGCGEGYYTAEVAKAGSEYRWSVYGSDLSKDGLKAAAKRSSELTLVAASSYQLPAATASCDALLCLFAPEAIEEFGRLLKTGGLMIEAVPGEQHLFGLKQAIYDTPYENTVSRKAPSGFTIADCIKLRYSVTLNDKALISHLFGMTPYAYHTNADGLERAAALNTLTTDLHFYLFVYQKIDA